MNKLLIGLCWLISVSAFAKDDLVCSLSLFDRRTNELLASKVLVQGDFVGSFGTSDGSDFYLESKKRRFLRAPLVLTRIEFQDFLDPRSKSARFQFYRRSQPNRYGVMTKTEKLGDKIEMHAPEARVEVIEERYAVKAACEVRP